MSTEKNLQRIIDLMARDESVDAPADSVRWASNLFRTRAAEPKKSILKKLAAVLEMELAPNRPAFGERSASATQVRQMLYRAGDNAVELRIESKNKGFSLRGQILGEGFAAASIELSNDSRVFKVRASEMSEFEFADLPAGRYQLLIRGEGFEITLKTIDIE